LRPPTSASDGLGDKLHVSSAEPSRLPTSASDGLDAMLHALGGEHLCRKAAPEPEDVDLAGLQDQSHEQECIRMPENGPATPCAQATESGCNGALRHDHDAPTKGDNR